MPVRVYFILFRKPFKAKFIFLVKSWAERVGYVFKNPWCMGWFSVSVFRREERLESVQRQKATAGQQGQALNRQHEAWQTFILSPLCSTWLHFHTRLLVYHNDSENSWNWISKTKKSVYSGFGVLVIHVVAWSGSGRVCYQATWLACMSVFAAQGFSPHYIHQLHYRSWTSLNASNQFVSFEMTFSWL